MGIFIASAFLGLTLLWPLVITELEISYQIDAPDVSLLLGVIASTAMLFAIYKAVEERPDRSATFVDFLLFGWVVALLLSTSSLVVSKLYDIAVTGESPSVWIAELGLYLALISLNSLQFPMLLRFLLSPESKFSTMFQIQGAVTLRTSGGVNVWGAAIAFFLSVGLWGELLWEAWESVNLSFTSSMIFAAVSFSVTAMIYAVGLRAMCIEAKLLTSARPDFDLEPGPLEKVHNLTKS